jgi:hypothetical protein
MASPKMVADTRQRHRNRQPCLPTKCQFEFYNVRWPTAQTLPLIGGTTAGPAGSSVITLPGFEKGVATRHVIGPRVRAQDRTMVALPATRRATLERAKRAEPLYFR